jgi:Amt family ammonium transporter
LAAIFEFFLNLFSGTVVHITSGSTAFVASLIVGRRPDANEKAKPHNIPFVLLGAALLWFGWFGFNGGSGKISLYSFKLSYPKSLIVLRRIEVMSKNS